MVKIIQLFIILSFVSVSLTLMVKIDGAKDKYCFLKRLYDEEQVNLNFLVSSEKKEELNVYFINEDSHTTLFETKYQDQSGDYKSPKPLPVGNYSLCFYPRDRNQYFITFELYTLFEGSAGLKELAKDKEFKKMGAEVQDIKKVFQEIETNLKR